MAKILFCDRCQTKDNQPDFDHFTIYREDVNGKSVDHFELDLCGQCGVEFREFYRHSWDKEAKRA